MYSALYGTGPFWKYSRSLFEGVGFITHSQHRFAGLSLIEENYKTAIDVLQQTFAQTAHRLLTWLLTCLCTGCSLGCAPGCDAGGREFEIPTGPTLRVFK